jgi:hypothetical protein
VGLRWISAAALAAALAPLYGASASPTTPDGALGELRSRVDAAELSPLARLSQARRAQVRFGAADLTVQPLGADFSGVRCGRRAPNAISGFMVVQSEATGQVHLGDFFPSLNRAGTVARSWLVGIRNVTAEPQNWFGGVVCAQARVRYLVFESAVGPFGSDSGVISCPRGAPNAVSGFFLVRSETTGDIQLGDFFPELDGPPRRARSVGWVIGVKNLTERRQEWLGGVVCTRATVRFSTGSGKVEPLATAVGRARCPAAAPNAVSGLSLVVPAGQPDTAVTGQLRLGDFFPRLRGPKPVARAWTLGVQNTTEQPQEWIWGAMCLGSEPPKGRRRRPPVVRGAPVASSAQTAAPRVGRAKARIGARARRKAKNPAKGCKNPLWALRHPKICKR